MTDYIFLQVPFPNLMSGSLSTLNKQGTGKFFALIFGLLNSSCIIVHCIESVDQVVILCLFLLFVGKVLAEFHFLIGFLFMCHATSPKFLFSFFSKWQVQYSVYLKLCRLFRIWC